MGFPPPPHLSISEGAVGVLCPVWATQYKEGTDTLEQAQQRDYQEDQRAGMLFKLGCVFFSLQKRRPRRKLVAVGNVELTKRQIFHCAQWKDKRL